MSRTLIDLENLAGVVSTFEQRAAVQLNDIQFGDVVTSVVLLTGFPEGVQRLKGKARIPHRKLVTEALGSVAHYEALLKTINRVMNERSANARPYGPGQDPIRFEADSSQFG